MYHKDTVTDVIFHLRVFSWLHTCICVRTHTPESMCAIQNYRNSHLSGKKDNYFHFF